MACQSGVLGASVTLANADMYECRLQCKYVATHIYCPTDRDRASIDSVSASATSQPASSSNQSSVWLPITQDHWVQAYTVSQNYRLGFDSSFGRSTTIWCRGHTSSCQVYKILATKQGTAAFRKRLSDLTSRKFGFFCLTYQQKYCI